ncbi:MAG TPA: ABC transporter permease [Candidatus Limnocylindria bacterium]|jgi:ABC-2 type transport system permease protein|nr:ABC transporter permease [Candidatus Limnocylindria bacterium]
MRQTRRLTALLLRAYVRDQIALFFSLVVPLMLMVIFGYLNLGEFGRVSVAIDDQEKNESSKQFIDVLKRIDSLQVREQATEEALVRLRRTELDMLVVIPKDFVIAPARPGQQVAQIIAYGDDARPQQVAVGRQIIAQVIDRLSFAVTQTAPVIAIKEETVQGVRLRYVDFLVPGILGVNIMQLAIFSVAFALVADKHRGVLRRIMATPVRVPNLLTAHVLTRLVIAAGQVAVLLLVALVLFQVTIVGGLAPLVVVALLGTILFLTIGFALAGWAQTENQVPAVAQLITLPQFFFSGVFFSKNAAPEVIRPITNLLPLTFLNDALREISVQGATLWDVRTQILGLLVWTVLGFLLAVRLFRFERF